MGEAPLQEDADQDSLEQRVPRGLLHLLVVLIPLAISTVFAFPADLPRLVVAGFGGAVLFGLTWPTLSTTFRRSSVTARVLLGSVFALALWTVVSVVRAERPWLAAVGQDSRFIGMIAILGATMVVVVVPGVLHRREQLDRILDLLSLAIGIASGVAILQSLGMDPWLGGSVFGGRPIAMFGNPNNLAAIAAIGAPLATHQWMVRPRDRRRGALFGAMLIATLILAGSLLGWVAAVAGTLAYLLAYLSSGRAARGWIIAVSPLGSLLGGLAIVSFGANAGYASAQARLAYWATGWEMVRANPVAGVGTGRMDAYYREFRPLGSVIETGREISSISTHSWLLDLWATLGTIGAVLLVVSLISAGLLLRNLWLRGDLEARARVAVLAGLLSAHGAQSSIAVPTVATVWIGYLILGMVVAEALTGEPLRRRDEEGSPARTGVVLLTVAIIAVLVALPLGATLLSARDLQQSDVAASAGDPVRARGHAERAINRTPWWPNTWIAMANNNPGPAIEDALLGALRADPRDVNVRLNLSGLAIDNGDLRQARDWLEEARELDPHGVQLHVQLAEWAVIAGEPTVARDALDQLARLPKDVDNLPERVAQIEEGLADL